MEKVRIEEIESLAPPDENIPDGALADSVGGSRPLAKPLGVTGFSINHYELEPGESFTISSHRHAVQEEVFYILAGTVTFETENGTVVVESGEIIRIPPDTFQLGTNDRNEHVVAITLGAPLEYQAETEWLVDCDECGESTVHLVEEGESEGVYVFRCTQCDNDTFRTE